VGRLSFIRQPGCRRHFYLSTVFSPHIIAQFFFHFLLHCGLHRLSPRWLLSVFPDRSYCLCPVTLVFFVFYNAYLPPPFFINLLIGTSSAIHPVLAPRIPSPVLPSTAVSVLFTLAGLHTFTRSVLYYLIVLPLSFPSWSTPGAKELNLSLTLKPTPRITIFCISSTRVSPEPFSPPAPPGTQENPPFFPVTQLHPTRYAVQ